MDSHIQELIQLAKTNPHKLKEAIASKSADEIVALQKQINPFSDVGIVNHREELCVNMSITNWSEKYLKKLTLTTMIGFLYQLAGEYPEGAERSAIKGFLDKTFRYDPNRHVASLGKLKKINNEDITAIRDEVKSAHAATVALPTNVVVNSACQAVNTFMGQATKFMERGAFTDDACVKSYRALTELHEQIKPYADHLSALDVTGAAFVVPSANLMHSFNRYQINNYEQLRAINEALYVERPDIEFAVMVHSVHKTEREASEWCKRHESQFKTDVFSVPNNKIIMLGPFKENRERLDFYTKHTEILKLMTEQNEADQKLGKDIMQKRVALEKQKNIAEAGPDAAGLASYKKNSSIVHTLGAKSLAEMDSEEREKYLKARTELETAALPDAAVQVDYFFTDETGSMQRGYMYTEEVKPQEKDKPLD